MIQKFPKLSFVHVCKDMPSDMIHFESDFDAIVDGTYLQQYGGGERSAKQYCVFKIVDGKVVNCIAWYYEDQLTLLPDQDRELAEQMIEDYRLRR